MIDMHMHSIYSDGDKTIEELLRICEEKKLEYISLTDHNTCKQYEDNTLKNKNIFNGKIITGTELNAVFKDRNIEILAYKVNLSIINEWLQKYYSEENIREQQEICKDRLLNICKKQGLVYDESKIKISKKANEYVEVLIYKELMSHKENYEKLGELAESFSAFYRKGLSNPKSEYYSNRNEFRPKYKEVMEIIHKAGGKAFLAHPFEYEFEDIIGFINDLRKETELDGIECYHPSAEDDNKKDILIEYAKNNNLYISGGSDYHGRRKPDIEIGIGRGSLNVPKKIVEEWI